MKKLIIAITITSMLLIGCGTNMEYKGKLYDTYGLFNKEEVMDECIDYELIVGNVILGIFFVETIIAPIYFFGFSIYEPVGVLDHAKCK